MISQARALALAILLASSLAFAACGSDSGYETQTETTPKAGRKYVLQSMQAKGWEFVTEAQTPDTIGSVDMTFRRTSD